jgi:2,3-bisphosphoglycerate-dependent phosphoglycerate mutase
MLYLVRHAHSDWTPDEMRPLSASGRAAAERVADVLAPMGVVSIHSSDFARAVETVRPLADRLGLTIETHPELRERQLSAGEVADFKEAVKATWDDFAFRHPGGESSAAAQARVGRAVRRIAASAPGGNVAIASHGNAIALFLHTLDPQRVDYGFWDAMTFPDIHAVDTPAGAGWTFRRIWPGG